MAELLFEVWKLIGRIMEYPRDCKYGLLTPIYKKGDPSEQKNHRPVCMLSRIRKIIETEIGERISKKCKSFCKTVQVPESIIAHHNPAGRRRGNNGRQ